MRRNSWRHFLRCSLVNEIPSRFVIAAAWIVERAIHMTQLFVAMGLQRLVSFVTRTRHRLAASAFSLPTPLSSMQ
jgi:hypothetical protein